MSRKIILAIEDNPTFREEIKAWIGPRYERLEVITPDSPEQLTKILDSQDVSTMGVLCDHNFSKWYGSERNNIVVQGREYEDGVHFLNIMLKEEMFKLDPVLYSTYDPRERLTHLKPEIRKRINYVKKKGIKELLPEVDKLVNEINMTLDKYSSDVEESVLEPPSTLEMPNEIFELKEPKFNSDIQTQNKLNFVSSHRISLEMSPEVQKEMFLAICRQLTNPQALVELVCGRVSWELISDMNGIRVEQDQLFEAIFWTNFTSNNSHEYYQFKIDNYDHFSYPYNASNDDVLNSYRKYVYENPKLKPYIEAFFATILFDQAMNESFENMTELNQCIDDDNKALFLTFHRLTYKFLSENSVDYFEFQEHLKQMAKGSELNILEYYEGEVVEVRDDENIVKVVLTTISPTKKKIPGDLWFSEFSGYQKPEKNLGFEVVIYTYRSERVTQLLPKVIDLIS